MLITGCEKIINDTINNWRHQIYHEQKTCSFLCKKEFSTDKNDKSENILITLENIEVLLIIFVI